MDGSISMLLTPLISVGGALGGTMIGAWLTRRNERQAREYLETKERERWLRDLFIEVLSEMKHVVVTTADSGKETFEAREARYERTRRMYAQLERALCPTVKAALEKYNAEFDKAFEVLPADVAFGEVTAESADVVKACIEALANVKK